MQGDWMRDALRAKNEASSAVGPSAGHFAIRTCTRRPVVATGLAWCRSRGQKLGPARSHGIDKDKLAQEHRIH